MQPARVIVCERTGQWAGTLRRVLSESRDRICETRSLNACWEELARSPASLLALEVTARNGELLVQRLLELPRRFPQARAIVLGEAGWARYEWAVREAGAAHAVFAPRRLPAAARLIARHLALAAQPALPLREAVWQRLPWRSA